MYCKNCGAEIQEKTKFCPSCGKATSDRKQSQQSTKEYGEELGKGIKIGLQGLNTVCSTKKRKTAILLIIIPLLICISGFTGIGVTEGNGSGLFALMFMAGLLLGIYQFYVGKFGKGILYTITMGGFFVGCLIDLFKLTVTKTFKDANGFPLIY